MARTLTKKQKGFAKDYLETGNATLAVKNNYNVSTENSAAALGSNILRNSKVREYIEGKAELAASYVFEIASAGDNDVVRLSASKDILDRAGFKPIEKNLNVNMNIEPAQSEEIRRLTDKLNDIYRGTSITSDGGTTSVVGTEAPN